MQRETEGREMGMLVKTKGDLPYKLFRQVMWGRDGVFSDTARNRNERRDG
jgi:hypothetical protein